MLRPVLLLVAALLLAPAPAQADPAADRAFIGAATDWMRKVFELPADGAVDPDLRAAAAQMADEHLVRLPALLQRWLDEERGQSRPSEPAYEAERRVSARLTNELSLWRLRSAGASHDEAWLTALQQADLCRSLEKTRSYYDHLVRLWQQVPRSQRAPLLAAETEVLQRWGTPLRLAPPEEPSVADDVDRLSRAARAGQRSWTVPMTPVVAAVVLRAGRLDGSDHDARCAVLQWWLRNALAASPGTQERLLATWRHAAMPTASWWFRSDPPPADDPAGYPPLALRWIVEGRIVAEVGGPAEAPRIVARDVTVPGIRQTRPVAFETVFDEATLAKARALEVTPGGGGSPRRVEFVWRLQ